MRKANEKFQFLATKKSKIKSRVSERENDFFSSSSFTTDEIYKKKDSIEKFNVQLGERTV